MKKVFWIILIFLITGYTIWQNDDFQRKYIYPFPERQTITKYAQRYDVDPYLVAGVAMAESKFDAQIKSSKGAQGIMQLMPETAIWIAHQMEDDNFQVAKLAEPDINIKYGTWYLGELKQEFHGNPILILAAYNAGRGNVHHWMEEGNWDMDFDKVDEIPFPETREYIKRVMLNTKEYHRLYGNLKE